MDTKFKLFESWYKSQMRLWESNGIIFESSNLYNNQYGHSYGIFLKSKFGFGEIHLYESNNIYWIDFDVCTDINISFSKCNVTDKSIFCDAYKKFIEYLTLDVIDKNYFKDYLYGFVGKD